MTMVAGMLALTAWGLRMMKPQLTPHAFLTKGKGALPPSGDERGLKPPLSIPPIWERLKVEDIEEALEEGDSTEDILNALRKRLQTYAQTPTTLKAPHPALSTSHPALTGPVAASLSLAQTLGPDEPTIQEVHQAAIRYAEVMPEKIRTWRTLAQIRNVIPHFTISLDRDRRSNIVSSSNRGIVTFAEGPEDRSVGVDFGFTWDLSNLIWDSAQTSIDVRSRLMVQLRRDILKEVTQLYFERLRLMAEFAANPSEDPILLRERTLRLEELTAHLDALTGGLYSKRKVLKAESTP
jgi:hypothetical protein